MKTALGFSSIVPTGDTSVETRIAPIQKKFTRNNFFTPTYTKAPTYPLEFDQVLKLAQRRREFHKHLAFESKEGLLDYPEIRTLSVDYGVPFRQFQSNEVEIETDNTSFFSLMLASLSSEESMQRFAEDEERLFYDRLKFAGVSVDQIETYFWPNLETKVMILQHTSEEEDVFLLPFEEALMIMDVEEADIVRGTVHLTTDNIYHIVCRSFKEKLLQNMRAYPDRNSTLTQSLVSELERMDRPKFVMPIDKIDHYVAKCFPPCMHRIYTSLKRNRFITYKARFELCLFFKAAGVDYFTQYDFWKDHIFDEEDAWYFESQVVLVLKQIYGLDDAEADYSPHKCITIINHDEPFAKQQVQGCPFSFLKKAELKNFLKSMRRRANHADIEDLTAFIPDEPMKACTQYFNATFTELPAKDELQRPIDYFLESLKRLES